MGSTNNTVTNASGAGSKISVSNLTIAAVVSSIAGFFVFIALFVIIGYFWSLRRRANLPPMTQTRRGRLREKVEAKGLSKDVLEAMPVFMFANAKIAEKGERKVTGFGASSTHIESVGLTKEKYNDVAARMPDALITVPMPAHGCQSEEVFPRNVRQARRTTIAGVTCLICVDDFVDGDRVRTLPCGHNFHPACIDPWLLDRSTACPSCRLSFEPPIAGEIKSDIAFAMNNANNV